MHLNTYIFRYVEEKLLVNNCLYVVVKMWRSDGCILLPETHETLDPGLVLDFTPSHLSNVVRVIRSPVWSPSPTILSSVQQKIFSLVFF